MHSYLIHFTKLSRFRGRLGVIALAIFGSTCFLESVSYGQTPVSPTKRSPPRQQVLEGTSSRDARESSIQRVPFQHLTADANTRLRSVIDNSSYFRRMPTETIDCDQEMFAFLVRHPEVIVNIWDIMGVTKVDLKRTGTFQLAGNDGAGTTSQMDLVYGTDSMHIYFASGSYRGNLWARELTGKCVVILHNQPTVLPSGKQGMVVSMDVFMKLDNLGADLVVKTLGPLVGKTADYNFVECAAFVSQISQTAAVNPQGIQQLAKHLNGIDPKIRDQFVATSAAIAQRHEVVASAQPVANSVASKPLVLEKVPSLTLNTTVPPAELSTRRKAETSPATTEERVDSPTILLLGKQEK
jgi:hypothetical protein